MDGHIDAVTCMAKNPNNLKGLFSGSADGGILFSKLDFSPAAFSLIVNNEMFGYSI